MFKHKLFNFFFLSLMIFFSATISQAQSWPSKQPIKFIVVYPPGGASDVTARLIAAKLTDSLGQSVIVENRPGANGIIATEFVAKSSPDGYTLLMANLGPNALNPVVYKKLPYDALKDLKSHLLLLEMAHQIIYQVNFLMRWRVLRCSTSHIKVMHLVLLM